eukprot:comp19651_c0_seq1/m.23249 comp19651_c0_seq1/g.23249  ORF comp19651_c0_seq1/g.23249 comp19651_c0_seq1/m.23249 type:complete len:206 (-) comp19651_c0_seq1:539-1156(-)
MADSHQFKIVLLGEGCVGKTSIVLRYCQNTFNDKHITTVQASFLTKKITIDRKRITLNIWDTAGQERFHALGPIYYRESNGAILVYDITDQDSFTRVQTWVRELQKMLGMTVCLVIVGNKVDLERERSVNRAEAERYAQSVGAQHVETSAKLNVGIEEMFIGLTQGMIKAAGARPSQQLRTNYSDRLVLTEDDTDAGQQKAGGCC